MLTILSDGVLHDDLRKKNIDYANESFRYLADFCELENVKLLDVVLLVKKCKPLHGMFNNELLNKLFNYVEAHENKCESLCSPNSKRFSDEKNQNILKLNREFYFSPASTELTVYSQGIALWDGTEYRSVYLSKSEEILGLNLEIASEVRVLRDNYYSVSHYGEFEWFFDMPQWTLFEIINSVITGIINGGSDEDKEAEIEEIKKRIESDNEKIVSHKDAKKTLTEYISLYKQRISIEKEVITDSRFFFSKLEGPDYFYGLSYKDSQIDNEWLVSVISFIQDDVLMEDFLLKVFGEKVILNEALKGKTAYEYRFLSDVFNDEDVKNGKSYMFTEKYDQKYKENMPKTSSGINFFGKSFTQSNRFLNKLLHDKGIEIDLNSLKTVDLVNQIP